MSVLTLVPRNVFSWNFSVLDGDQTIADVHLSWRERGTLTVDGVDYNIYRESLLGVVSPAQVVRHVADDHALETRHEFRVRLAPSPGEVRLKPDTTYVASRSG